MAMIKCPDCKTPISDSAECCPRCGCKFRADYQEMLMLRNSISNIESKQKRDGAKPSVGGTVTLILGICLALLGVWLFTLDGLAILLALVAIGGGGFLAFVGFIFLMGPVDEQNAYNRSVDEAKASLPERRRRLAQLEAKFR